MPYYIIVLSSSSDINDYSAVSLNSFFIIGTLSNCFIIRFFHEKSRSSEIKARYDLRQEIESRDKIIRTKTEEGIRLKALSSQFSPQIVESIHSGKLSLESGSSRAQICVIFIDIVGSTERVTQLDKDKIEKVIGKFLDDAIKILLLYDLTIDKFMGDGIIAFCNAPQKRPDFISRVVMAALDVRHKIEQDRGFYEKYWGQALGIRIGIAQGFVNVGFYGSQKHFRNYTAIGPALALAARLCSTATPNQILIDLDIYEKIASEFDAVFVDKKELKGFHLGLIHTYEIRGVLPTANSNKFLVTECPTCYTNMSLEENQQGQLALYCKSCQTFVSDKDVLKTA
jgi:class 3 adenylate cyclase